MDVKKEIMNDQEHNPPPNSPSQKETAKSSRAAKLAHVIRVGLTLLTKAGLAFAAGKGGMDFAHGIVFDPPQVPGARLDKAFDEAKASLRYQLPDDACIPIHPSVDDDGNLSTRRKFTIGDKSFVYDSRWASISDGSLRDPGNVVRLCDVGSAIVFIDAGGDLADGKYAGYVDQTTGGNGKQPMWLGDQRIYPGGKIIAAGKIVQDFRLIVTDQTNSFDRLVGERGTYVIRQEELMQLAESHLGIPIEDISSPTQVGNELWSIVKPTDPKVPDLILLKISFSEGWGTPSPELSYFWAQTQDELRRALKAHLQDELPNEVYISGSQIDTREEIVSSSGNGWVGKIDKVGSTFFLDEMTPEKWELLRKDWHSGKFPSIGTINEAVNKVELSSQTVLSIVRGDVNDPSNPEPWVRSITLNSLFSGGNLSAQFVEGDTGENSILFVTTQSEIGIVIVDQEYLSSPNKINLKLNDYLNAGIQFRCTFENNHLLIQGFKDGEEVVNLQSSKVFGENGDPIGALGLHLVQPGQ